MKTDKNGKCCEKCGKRYKLSCPVIGSVKETALTCIHFKEEKK